MYFEIPARNNCLLGEDNVAVVAFSVMNVQSAKPLEVQSLTSGECAENSRSIPESYHHQTGAPNSFLVSIFFKALPQGSHGRRERGRKTFLSPCSGCFLQFCL